MSFLIHQAKRSADAFARLYEAHVNSIYQYCVYRLPTREEAEDLTSEVWETALNHIEDLKSDHPVVFKAWLFKIAKNAINKRYSQKNRTHFPLDENTEKIPDKEKTPHAFNKDRENAEELRQLVEALPEKQRETIALHFFSGLKNKEIAALLELSEKTVASNLCRGLETLHGWLKKLQ